jgi:hypothetical protein
MDPDHVQAGAFRDQLWSSLPALRPEIERIAKGDFDASERQRQIIQIVARVVLAELQFRADESRLEP